ncbi:hypothetical protein ACUW95_000492 [Staphylococcus hominis]
MTYIFRLAFQPIKALPIKPTTPHNKTTENELFPIKKQLKISKFQLLNLLSTDLFS